jgi:hypothetical protein
MPARACFTFADWQSVTSKWPEKPHLVTRAPVQLGDSLKKGPMYGGSTGHCPKVGKPVGPSHMAYGSEWIPIGFSRDGAFAGAALTDHDATSPQLDVRVISLIEDKELGRVVWTPEPGETLRGMSLEATPRVGALLAEFAIEPGIQVMEPRPYTVGGAKLSVSIGKGRPLEDQTHVQVSSVVLTKADVGKKWIGEVRGGPVLVGVIRSPFEPRIAVITTTNRYSFEATTECGMHVLGAHTETRFK